VIGCVDEEIESLHRQLSQCQIKLEKLERERNREIDVEDMDKWSELETVRERLSCVLALGWLLLLILLGLLTIKVLKYLT